MDTFLEIGLVLVMATLVSCIIRFLKQPLILGYILTGLIVGPSLLNLIKSTETITLFSHMGIALLLFLVGININPKVIKEVGLVSLITGLGQVIITTLLGFGIALLFGFSTISSLYLGIALAFSSTIIIMKLLSDKNDTEKLYGKISIGFLIVQDLVAILALMIVSSLGKGLTWSYFVLTTVLKGIGLISALILVGVFILPWLTRIIAKSQELLLLFSMSWAFALSLLFSYTGFSIEIGALLAGVTLSFSPYRYEISSKLKPVHDFFLVLFFILLGYQIGLDHVSNYLLPILALSALVFIGNPLITISLMGWLGYTKRTSFFAGLTVAQISEFSLVLVTLGVSVGHLSQDILTIITAVGLITMAGSSYLLLYAEKIYAPLAPYLGIFERKGKKLDDPKQPSSKYYDIILFGCDRAGHDLIEIFKKMKKKFLVVDYNPEIIMDLTKKKINCIYGDASDLELLRELNLSTVKMIVSTIPDYDISNTLIHTVREVNKKAILVVVSHRIEEAVQFYKEGASYVILPNHLGGYHASMLIEKHGLNLKKFFKEKSKHLEHLKKRHMK